jgi:hypothetical protein
MNKIRAIHERRPDTENPIHGRIMVYQVGSFYTVEKDDKGRPIKREIIEIILHNEHFMIYLSSSTEVMLWKEIGKTEFVSIEYFVDLED